mmetsp:Transcript_2063/g.4439  ORF Transcript_2063/g.4439 Transcript_2063/m.4439 type:complete len:98 (-) Transcript_2063:25-318(-)
MRINQTMAFHGAINFKCSFVISRRFVILTFGSMSFACLFLGKRHLVYIRFPSQPNDDNITTPQSELFDSFSGSLSSTIVKLYAQCSMKSMNDGDLDS